MEATEKPNTEFKPHKKMKKRRELDALTNGKVATSRRKRGQQEPLINSTDSSDIEEFSLSQRSLHKKQQSHCQCISCLMVSGCMLLAACVVVSVGLIWVHVELKRDVDDLRSQLNKVTTESEKNPNDYQDLHKAQQDLVTQLDAEEKEVISLHAEVTAIIKQISILNTTTGDLVSSVATAPILLGLPATIKQISQSVANIGSEVKNLQDGVTSTSLQSFKTSVLSRIDSLESRVQMQQVHETTSQSSGDSMNNKDDVTTNSVKEELLRLYSIIERLNATSEMQSQEVLLALHNVNLEILQLKNRSSEMSHESSISDPMSLSLLRPSEKELKSIVNEIWEEKIKNLSSQKENSADDFYASKRRLENLTENISILKQQLALFREEEIVKHFNLTLYLNSLHSNIDDYNAICSNDMQRLNTTVLALSEKLLDEMTPSLQSVTKKLSALEGISQLTTTPSIVNATHEGGSGIGNDGKRDVARPRDKRGMNYLRHRRKARSLQAFKRKLKEK